MNLDPHIRALADLLVGVAAREIREEMNARNKRAPMPGHSTEALNVALDKEDSNDDDINTAPPQ